MKNTWSYVLLKNDTSKLDIDMQILGIFSCLRDVIGKEGVVLSVKNNNSLDVGKTIRESGVIC